MNGFNTWEYRALFLLLASITPLNGEETLHSDRLRWFTDFHSVGLLEKKEYLQQCRLDSYSPVNVLSGSKVYTRNTLPIPLPSTMYDTENYDANNSSNGENNPVHQRKSLIILQILW